MRFLVCVTLAAGIAMAPAFLIDQFIYFPEKHHDSRPEDFGLPSEDVEIRTEDGVKLHAWWIGDPSLRCTVLFFHGNAGNISHRLDRIRAWKEVPVRFLLVDYRGYGKSAGSPSEEGLYRDARAAYDFLAGRSIPASQIFLFGESLGGAVAIELAGRVKSAGLILESTFTSLRELAPVHYPFIPSALIPDQYRSLDRISRVQVPVFIAHGTADEIVPFEMGRRLHEAARDPKTFHPVDAATHNDVYLQGGSSYRNALKSFLDACASS